MAPIQLADWISGGSFVVITGELFYLRYKRAEFRSCRAFPAFIAVLAALTLTLAGEEFFGLKFITAFDHNHNMLLAIFSLSVAIWLGRTIGQIRHLPSYRELEEKVQERTAVLQSIIDCSPVAIVQGTAQRIVTIWNPAAEKLFGWKAEEVMGKPLPTIPAFKEAEAENAINETINNHQLPALMTQRKHKDGHLIDVCLWNAPMLTRKGQPKLAMGFFADMGPEKRLIESLAKAKAAAERANDAKTRFLAHMSHEIRTPLSAIIGFGELLQKEEAMDPAQRAKFTDTLVRNGRCLALLIDDILDMSKVEAGEMTIDRQPCSVRDLLKDVRTTLELRAVEKGISLELNVNDRVPGEAYIDCLRLRQIVMNVASNAVKFTTSGGVFISADYAAGNLKIIVRDSGPGMSLEQQAQLFRSYAQCDSSTSSNYGGTGLGLYLSRELAKLMEGHLILKDSAPGRGSTFEIQIPAPVFLKTDTPRAQENTLNIRLP